VRWRKSTTGLIRRGPVVGLLLDALPLIFRVKVPPPEKPPTYDKERTLTRRTVAGAAGGMLGVDYEDTRHLSENAPKREGPAREAAGREALKEQGPKRTRRIIAAAPKEEAEMILQDEDPITRDEKTRERARRGVARDRMSIDKDAPQLLRKRRWDQDDEPAEEPDEIDLELFGAGELGGFEERRAFVGDPRLTDPLAIKEALGSPVAYAKHAMILAEAFRTTTGATRQEAIGYLALMFAALGDRNFARQALKELGPATGIVDLYPLEVTERVIEFHPGLLLKVGFGTLFARSKKKEPVLELEAGVPHELHYRPGLKIRGFALKGGGRPGYRFQPGASEGLYTLTIFVPGRHQLLISALARSGHTVIDRLDVLVREGPHALPPLEEPTPERDEAKIAAWPKPAPIPIDYERVLDEEDPKRADSGTMLTTSERISLQQRDALTQAADETVQFIDAEEEETFEEPPPEPVQAELVNTEDTLSRAEASLLKLAVVLGTGPTDLNLAPDPEPRDEEITVSERAYQPPED
jgi:hypothetical protein